MKKETLLEIILGTLGGIIFAIGMCMCLIVEWDLLKLGIILGIIGFIILLCIIPVYRINHPKKKLKSINWSIVLTWIVGIIGSLLMGLGMSKVMVGNPNKIDLLLGILIGIIGLLICVLNYPVYAYLKDNKND